MVSVVSVKRVNIRDETGSSGHESPGLRISDFGRVGSRVRVNVSDPLFDLILSLNMRVYRGVVSTE